MLIPVRCFTCGTVIANQYPKLKKRVEKGEKTNDVLNDLNVTKFCCRRMLIAQADLIESILPFNN